MGIELTQEVSGRLASDHYGWLTTVAKSGQPVPRLIWFYFDGADLTVYSMPKAAKVAHILQRPHVSLNLDSDGNGGGLTWQPPMSTAAKTSRTGPSTATMPRSSV